MHRQHRSSSPGFALRLTARWSARCASDTPASHLFVRITHLLPADQRATKADVCRRFSLPARDLRLFFDGSQNAALLGRERALLLRLRPSARAILSATEVFFPVADDVALAQAVSEHLKDHSTKRPFEMRVLDIALERECARLDLEAVHLEADAKLVLERLVARVSSEHLEMTRRLKGSVGRALGEATALANELGRFLDDDSDMRSLMLTAPSRPLREVEDLLETYAAQVNGCRSKLSLIDEAIADTETARPPTLLQSRNFRRSCSRAPHFTTYHSALTPPSLIRRAQFLSRDLDAKRNLYVGCNLTFSAAAFSERLWTALAKAAGGGKDKDREEN